MLVVDQRLRFFAWPANAGREPHLKDSPLYAVGPSGGIWVVGLTSDRDSWYGTSPWYSRKYYTEKDLLAAGFTELPGYDLETLWAVVRRWPGPDRGTVVAPPEMLDQMT